MTELTGNMEEAVTSLTQMGLTAYEAKVLVALLRLGRSTVREIYPVSGVPRAAVYGVLYRWRAKWLVQMARTRPTSYMAVSAEEAIEILQSDFERRKQGALEVLSNINTAPSKTESDEEVWLLNDRDSVLRASKRLIMSANREILVGLFPQRLAELSDVLLQSAKGGVKVSVLSGSAPDIPETLFPFVNLIELREPERFSRMPELSLLIADDSLLLFSMKNPLDERIENGFWSRSRALISFFSISLRISIKGLEVNGK